MVRVLESFLQDAKLVQEGQLAWLKNTRLGIDLTQYLRDILSSPQHAEPLVAAIGAQPLALVAKIEADLAVLEQHRIKPVFVLNGLAPAKRTRPFRYEDRRPGMRARAWEAYEAGNVALAYQHFNASNSIHFPDLYRTVLRIFRQKRIDFLVAPYLATGQLVLLGTHDKQYVHAMFGPMELLAFEHVDKMLMHIDFERGTFRYVSKPAVLQELQCNESEFLDTALLLGMEYCSTFPALQDPSTGLLPTNETPSVRAVVQLVQQHRSGFALCTQFAEHPMVAQVAYLDQFCHARTMIKYCMVLAPGSTTVVPLPLVVGPASASSDIPSDLHEIFSFRLPDEAVLALSRGWVGAPILGSLLSGYVIEPAPLDNGETSEYQRFVREYLTESPQSPRCTAIALACAALHPFWRSRKVSAVYWFQPEVDFAIQHEAPAVQKLLAQNDLWYVSSAFLDKELQRQNSATIDLPLCLNTTADAARAKRTLGTHDASTHLVRKDELVANSFWRLLELRGFLSDDHTHTAYGRAAHTALGHLRINDRAQEPLFLALELIRAQVLHSHVYSGRSYSGGASLGSEEEMGHTLLVMRCLSLLSIGYKRQAWDAPLSRELLIFNSFAKALARSLRSLVEMVTLSLLLKRTSPHPPRDDYLDLSLSLPFQADTNTGMGILVKCYLDALVTLQGGALPPDQAESPDVVEAKESVIEMLVETFDNIRDVTWELRRGFRFWDALVIAVDSLATDNAVPKTLQQQFHAADAWLRPMRL